MEHKIGEIFEYNGEWYQCVESDSCGECSLFTTECGSGTKSDLADKVVGQCSKIRRTDNKHVIFKKLEKVGEPYVADSKCCQQYQCYTTPLHNMDIIYTFSDNIVVLEIKNKENMEEKNKAEGLPLLRLVGKYMNSLINYATFEKAVKDLYSNKEEIKPTLKEFDLKAAKAGKPVCTRDGRKARIICFDAKGMHQPIIALITQDNGIEHIETYYSDGRFNDDSNSQSDYDLMMLPEKKEGWVNIYKGGKLDADYIYTTKADAVENIFQTMSNNYIDTIKVEWEE